MDGQTIFMFQGVCRSSAVKALLAALMLLFALLVGTPVMAQATSSTANTTSAAIPEMSSAACSATGATVLTRTFNVTNTFVVGDVDIGVLYTHGDRGHVRMWLTSPAGTTVNLMSNIGGTLNNLSVRFSDEAAAAISTHTANNDSTTTTYQRNFSPAAALSAFDGQAANGTWTLRLCDSTAGSTGTFTRSDLFLVEQSADLSLTKTVSNTTPTGGSAQSFTLTVTNSAASVSTVPSVTVRDILPAGATFTGSTASTGTYNSGTGLWTFGALAPGGTATLTINFTATTAIGYVYNQAEITALPFLDPDSTPNNGVIGEDDLAFAGFSIYRSADSFTFLNCPVGSTTFDWQVNTWTAGTTNNSYTLAGVGNFNITMVSDTPYLAGSPTINGNLTGGVTGEQSLYQNLNNNNLSDISTTTITLPGILPGIQFRLFDIDFFPNQFSDKVTVIGYRGATTVIPTLTNGQSNYITGNTVIGDMTALDTSAIGNVGVTFNAPIDRVVIIYGNHNGPNVPANPGNQWIGLGDITFCNPYNTNVSVTKISTVLNDGNISVTNPKAVPGATVQYCITVSNTGANAMTSVVAQDTIPANLTYVAESIRVGTNCGNATSYEDDNAIGPDETDLYSADFIGNTITGRTTSLAGTSSFAFVFAAVID
jgi:uncharacterized repeat protein (TIGR01451 family)